MEENFQPDFKYLCRLCLKFTENEIQHKIFDEEKLSNKIILILNLDNFTPSCGLPNSICRDCRYNVEKSYHFRTVAKNCDARLKKHVRLLNQGKPSMVLSKNYQDDDTEELEEMYLESYKYFDEARREVEKLKLEFETVKKRIIAEEVQKTIKKLEESKQPTPTKPQPIVTEKPPVLLNKLAPSNQKFQNSPAVRRKLKNETQSPAIVNEIVMGSYEIQFIDHEGQVVDETQQIYRENEAEIEIIEDNLVTEVEENEADEVESAQSDEDYKPPEFPIKKKRKVVENVEIKKRKRISENKKPLPIQTKESTNENVDDQYFTTIDANDKDLDENGEKKIFQCKFENCKESFARRQACKTHFFNHLTADSNGFTCKFCKKCFKVASALERHERVHTGDKPFACDFEGCEKAFSQKEMLKRHKLIHLPINDAPFPCNFCDKKFRQKEPLRWHINKEHSEDAETQLNPFICSICQKTFAHSSGLSRHFLIHSGKIFSCEICGKDFNDKSALKRHRNVHNK